METQAAGFCEHYAVAFCLSLEPKVFAAFQMTIYLNSIYSWILRRSHKEKVMVLSPEGWKSKNKWNVKEIYFTFEGNNQMSGDTNSPRSC